ncbi:MAG: valine--tRNA ligase [Clostridiales bacterium]|uniref:valine--tRNA ligase n=1 Tax=Provencibacterium massiliense TaxID=1841868 RepID=UPI0009A58FF1|nr:valine--tRNA ligase [Provencibacterium massiliense]PWM35015.1 MAG: valine--tRNA ligase [Clostridiales bacterium]RGB68665.1 valine--tRNA ligase [Harryflintia acetispora]
MRKQLDKTYDPKQFEEKTYQAWLQGGYFHAKPNPDKRPYTIVMPPPNITGQLHLGHAMDCTLQDCLIRFRRMQGYEALWLPGADHASIATEAKIVQKLKEEGVDKQDLGREGFLKRAWEWKEQYGGRIVEQQKKMGSSCDWDRARFTLDEGCSKAVNEVFCKLYDEGLIYRGERIINWCPTCKTSISDAEVEYEDHAGHFWHLRYPFTDGSGYIELATTRPETMLGDTAVAVHPDDERYKAMVGKTLTLPLVGREIPLIADEYVDMEFGTGVVKITPAHDPNDFEVGLRHELPVINVLNEDATLNEQGGKYAGMDRYEARRAIVRDLEEGGFLVRTEDHQHNVGACYRCRSVVEPRVSKQWFVRMEPLAGPAMEVVKNGSLQFVPERFAKIYYHWMENIRDWCISRQLWWGHRIPAWYCDDCGEITVAKSAPERCAHCGGSHIRQDEDTLDTWFSSALWPFSTLGWPDKTPELSYFYPTDTLVTGYDIIFFWVARMIFSGVHNMGEIPFKNVFIHGLIRDAQGRKMSKSLGNGVDPMEVIEQYGADALRLTLCTGNSPGNDMRFSDEKVRASRNFANKLWNASRFILMNLSDEVTSLDLPQELTLEDRWFLSLYNRLVREVTDNLEHFELGVAVQKLYDFIWDILCDWYIELTKARIAAGGESAKRAQQVLVHVMGGALRLLHPFMPFITEEIWQALPSEGISESVMAAPWPEYRPELCFEREEEEFSKIMEVIKAVRNRRSEMNVPPSRKAKLYIATGLPETMEKGAAFFERLAGASEVEIGQSFSIEGAVQVVTGDARIFIPLGELIDLDKERERLQKEREQAEQDVSFFGKKLENPSFVDRAPEKVVNAEREKLQKAKDRLQKIVESLEALK